MYITYHKPNTEYIGDEIYIPYIVLNEKIQDFILSRAVYQPEYMFYYYTDSRFSLYLNNGDRIDVQL